MNRNIVFSQRSILPANEKDLKTAIARLNPEKPRNEEEKSNYLKEAMAAGLGSEKRSAYASLKTEKVNLRVKGQTIATDFFETVTLRHDEVPAYEVEDPTPMLPINVVSTLGGSATVIYSDNLQRATFPLGYIETPWVRQQRMDLYQGIVSRADKIDQLIEESLTNQLDTMAWTAINATFGPFDANTWRLDPNIRNAPNTNDLDVRAVCNGRINKDLIKAIRQHFAGIGKRIRAVYFPSAREADLLDWVSVSGFDIGAAATVPVPVAEEIWNTGGLKQGGIVPPMIFTNTLEGQIAGQIYCYVVTDEAPGYFFQKPALHIRDEKEDGIWYYAKNTITASFVIPPYRRMNIARFLFG